MRLDQFPFNWDPQGQSDDEKKQAEPSALSGTSKEEGSPSQKSRGGFRPTHVAKSVGHPSGSNMRQRHHGLR